MHEFSTANDRIYRAGINTFGAADTFIFTNNRFHALRTPVCLNGPDTGFCLQSRAF